MLILNNQPMPDQKLCFSSKILSLMTDGEYKSAADCVLEHAEELANEAATLSGKEKDTLLEKSDCIASTYRELMFLASSQQLQELHQTQNIQIAKRTLKIKDQSNLTSQIVEQVASFIEVYESLAKLFVIHLTRENIFNTELNRLKTFSNIDSSYTKEQFLQDLFMLLGHVEPASTRFSFSRDRQQILGTRYKCERGYANATHVIEEIKNLLLKLEEITIPNSLSYQEIYWHCGVDITLIIKGILNKVSD